MPAQFTRTAAPAEEVVTLDEAKVACRALADVTDEDDLIEVYIRAAREYGEGVTGRGWLTQTWVLTLDWWNDDIQLPMAAPLQSVTTVKYYDSNGTLQTLSASAYVVDTSSQPGRVTRAPATSWPALQCDRTSWRVEITYVVGWTEPTNVPHMLRVGTLMLVDHWWEHRSAVEVGIGLSAIDVPMTTPAMFGERVYWVAPDC